MTLPDKIYTLTQAAKLCGLNRTTLWRWIKSNKLQAYQTPSGRYKIKKADLTQFIRQELQYIEPKLHETIHKILIIDDDESVRKLIRKILSKENHYEIEEAGTGLQAGMKIMKFKPSLIILDLLMPEIDGFEICHHVKTETDIQHIKIIAISGFSSQENKERIQKLGADIFLEKPINKKELLHNIKQLLAKSP